MADTVNLGQAEKLVSQLLPQEQLKLVVRICEQLSAMPFTASAESKSEQLWCEFTNAFGLWSGFGWQKNC